MPPGAIVNKVERLDLITMARNVAAARDLLKQHNRQLGAQCADTVLEELRALFSAKSQGDDRRSNRHSDN